MSDTVITCIQQKNIYIEKLLKVTEQMEAACAEDNYDGFASLLTSRSEFMKRIDKCNALLLKSIEELADEQREHVRKILWGSSTDQYPAEYKSLMMLQRDYNHHLEQLSEQNGIVEALMKKRHAELMESIQNKRKATV